MGINFQMLSGSHIYLAPHLSRLLRVNIPPRTNLDLPIPTRPVPIKQIRQVILIHHIALPRPAVLVLLARVLLLVLGENQIRAPVVLAAALGVGQLAVGAAVRGLGDAVDVAALVVDKVLAQVQLHLARRVGRAAHARERGVAAFGAELPVHLLGDGEAAVATQHPCLEVPDARKA